MVDSTFPKKVVLAGPSDLPYYTEDWRKLKRRKQRAYRTHGRRSCKYEKLRKEYEEKLKTEAVKYIGEIEREVQEGKCGSGYKAIRKLGNRPGEKWSKSEFMLPEYLENGLSSSEAGKKISRPFLSY